MKPIYIFECEYEFEFENRKKRCDALWFGFNYYLAGKVSSMEHAEPINLLFVFNTNLSDK